MKIGAGLAVVWLLATQSAHVSPRDLLSNPRPLTAGEIAIVLHASQRAITGKAFRLAPIGLADGPEILMGRGGMPRRIRWSGAIIGGVVGGVTAGLRETRPSSSITSKHDFVIITDYTGRPPRNCSGSAEQSELVVEYKLDSPSTAWQITARRRDARDFGGTGIAQVFKMLQGAVMLASGELKNIDGRYVRAVTSVWIPAGRSGDSPVLIGDPIPNMRGEPVLAGENQSVQSLWIDTKSLRPLRWEVHGGGLRFFGFDFKYSSFKIPLPPNVHPPECLR